MTIENMPIEALSTERPDLPVKPEPPLNFPTFTDNIFNPAPQESAKHKQHKESQEYEPVENLKDFLSQLDKRKFKLDCGHKVTFGYFLGNDIMIRNGKEMTITCSECAY